MNKGLGQTPKKTDKWQSHLFIHSGNGNYNCNWRVSHNNYNVLARMEQWTFSTTVGRTQKSEGSEIQQFHP